MEAWLVTLAVLVALGAVAVIAARLYRSLDRVTRAAGIDDAPDQVAAARALRDRADRASAELAAAEAERDAFVEWLPIGVVRIDERSQIVTANAATHTMLGRQPRSLVGRSVIEAFLDADVEAAVRTGLASGSMATEMARPGADGRRLIIRGRATTDGGGWLVLEDVTELRRLQQIRAEFIDNLSHELRTPLTTVSLLAETLTREAGAAGDAIPPRMRDRIEKIEVETGHLVQMVTELLDLSRIESGGALSIVELVDLGRIAADSAERLRMFADRQGVRLRIAVDEPIAPIRGDPDRLGQVVVNLVHNAVKFSPDGGDVDVTVRTDGSEVVVAIADHGVGVPRAAQARIFERFYKVDRARARGESGGTGLGLAIARHVVAQHGGRIWVRSTEGVGSTFSFAIPVASEGGASGAGAPDSALAGPSR